MSETQEKAGSGRAADGRFRKGNRGGPGNPFNRRIAELRRELMEAVSERLPKMVGALMDKAEAGDVAAIKVALEYSIGKPLPAVDPDRQDVEEWKLAAESMVSREAVEAVAIERVPVAFATALADVQAKVARMEMLFPSPEALAQRSREEQTGVRELAEELQEERRTYLEDKTFRQRWNESCRRAEQAEARTNGDNGSEIGEPRASATGATRRESVTAPIADAHGSPAVRRTSRLPNGVNGEAEPANGEIGDASPMANGG